MPRKDRKGKVIHRCELCELSLRSLRETKPKLSTNDLLIVLKTIVNLILVLICVLNSNILSAQQLLPVKENTPTIETPSIYPDTVPRLLNPELRGVTTELKANVTETVGELRSLDSVVTPVVPKLSLHKSKERLRKRYAYLNDTAAVNKKLESLSITDPGEVGRLFNKEINELYRSESSSLLSDFAKEKPWEQLDWPDYKSWRLPEFTKPALPDKGLNTKALKIKPDNTTVDEIKQQLSSLDEESITANLRGEASGIKKVYSEKALKKIYDSLGTKKMDSLLNVARKLSEDEVTEEQLLEAINRSFPEYAKSNTHDTTQLSSLSNGDLSALKSELGQKDLSHLKLPDSVLQEMPAVASLQTDSKYLRMIDSLRSVKLKAQGMMMEEQRITENIKATIVKQRPKFWDKAYLEGIVGVLPKEKGAIVKISPALGYHFTDILSVGLGPTINLNQENKSWNGQVGLRTFLKAEIWRQRLYLQAEDNIDPVKVDVEHVSSVNHSILAGGGCLLPISKNLALNPSILYRIKNSNPATTTGSPWVFRVGISSIGKKK